MKRALARPARLAAPWVGALCATLFHLAGCGGARYYGEPERVEPEREDPAALAREQRARAEALDAALARTEVDCASVCDLGGAICALSERICSVAERHPDDEGLGARCADAEARCERARERVAQACACE